MAEATLEDVRDLIDTDTDDETIQGVLDRVAREIERSYDDGDFEDDDHIADFESAVAAVRLEARARRVSSQQLGNAQVSYEEGGSRWLHALVRRLDPNGEFTVGRVNRDTDRHVQSANNTEGE